MYIDIFFKVLHFLYMISDDDTPYLKVCFTFVSSPLLWSPEWNSKLQGLNGVSTSVIVAMFDKSKIRKIINKYLPSHRYLTDKLVFLDLSWPASVQVYIITMGTGTQALKSEKVQFGEAKK